MSDMRHVHDAIIDNPAFNLTVPAKRALRALVETYGARVDELEAALDAESRNKVRMARWLLEQQKELDRLESQLESGMDGQSMLPTELLDGMHKRIERLEGVVTPMLEALDNIQVLAESWDEHPYKALFGKIMGTSFRAAHEARAALDSKEQT